MKSLQAFIDNISFQFKFVQILFLSAILSFSSFAQKADENKEINIKNPKADKIINKIIYGFSFLNYTDRKRDRVLHGPEDYEQYRGKRIQEIKYSILKPYGVSIEHPDTPVLKKLSRFANRIHISTKPRVIKTEMLIREGDTIDPQLVADMERNIWSKYIYKDQRISIHNVSDDTNQVVVDVMVQDLMTWNIVDKVGVQRTSFGVELKNFLGLSQSWNNYVAINYRRDKLWSFYGWYEFRNIASSQISLNLNYNYDPFIKGLELKVGRKFFSAQTKWAGFIFSNFYHQSFRETNFLAPAIPTNILYNAQAAWFARSYPLYIRSRREPNMTYKFIISAKFTRLQYLRRPYMISDDNSLSFINSNSYMVGVGMARWDYYTEQNINELVETEYFTKGFNLAFLSGFSKEEDAGERYYTAFVSTYARKIPKLGYFAWRSKWGTYIRKEKPENQVLSTNLLFFSNPINFSKKFYARQFLRFYYNQGWNFAPNQDLFLNDQNGGIRGMFLNTLRGERTFGMSVEPNFYSRFKIFGFTFTYFCFADIAMVGSGKGAYFNHEVMQGYGAGIRMRNLRIGLDYFILTFAYYPNYQLSNARNWQFLGNLSNPRSIGNYQGTLFDSRTMMFQNPSIGDADMIVQ